jgi:DivIVA domain-containing protein
MSVLDMDISARRTPQSIRKRRFAVVRRGFDPDQVQVYLEQIAGWIEQLESELHTAREELDAAARRAEQPVDPYNRLGARVAELMRTAEEQAERIQREAEEEASRKLDDLQTEVDRIRTEARAGAERLRREAEEEATRLQAEAGQTLERARTEAAQTLERARAEANSVLASLTGQRDMLVTELRGTRRRLSDLVVAIDATVQATPSIPAMMEGTPASGPKVAFDPWATPPVAPEPPEPPVPPRTAESAESPEQPRATATVEPPPASPEPAPPPVASAPAPTWERPEDAFDEPDPFAVPPEGGLFDDFATGPSYEGIGTGQPVFDDPELRPRPQGGAPGTPGFASNGFQAGGIGGSDIGEPASFELPAGEALDLGEYAEDDAEAEATPTIELSLPDIPLFGEEDDEEE